MNFHEQTGAQSHCDSDGGAADPDFVALLTRHQPDIWAFILVQLPGHPDVEDILQETNVALWTNRHRFEAGTDFITWSFTVAKFVVLRHLKKGKRSRWLVFRSELLDLISVEAPEVFGDGARRLHWLEACIGKLRFEDRELLRSRYHEHGSLEEYGRRVGRSAASLSVTLHRIRAALRTCIERGLSQEGGTP